MGFDEVKIEAPEGLPLKEMNGDQLLNGLIRGVEGIRAEKPEGIKIDDIYDVICGVAKVSESLFNIRNGLRKAKGLKPLKIEDCQEGLPESVLLDDVQRAVIFMHLLENGAKDANIQVAVLALLCGWTQERALTAFEKACGDGLAKRKKEPSRQEKE